MEVSTVLISLPVYFSKDSSDPFAVVFYHNGITSLLLGLAATFFFAIPGWCGAVLITKLFRRGEKMGLAIVAITSLLLPLVCAGKLPPEFSFAMSLVVLAFGVPLLVVDSLYPDKSAGAARTFS
jgi:hypothetical protein